MEHTPRAARPMNYMTDVREERRVLVSLLEEINCLVRENNLLISTIEDYREFHNFFKKDMVPLQKEWRKRHADLTKKAQQERVSS